MTNSEEQFYKLEKQYQESLDSQKRFYESELELLKSKFEYEKSKLKVEYENEKAQLKKEVEQFYNVKNTQDVEAIKNYYESELNNQKTWYEEEIVRRQKETEDWHIKNLEEKVSELTNGYEEMLQAQKDKFNVEMEVLSAQIIEQKKYYEEQLKPYRRIINFRKKVEKKFNIEHSYLVSAAALFSFTVNTALSPANTFCAVGWAAIWVTVRVTVSEVTVSPSSPVTTQRNL